MLYLKNDNYTNIIYSNLLDSLDGSVLINLPVDWSWIFQFTNDFTKESFTIIQIFNKSVYGSIADNNTVKLPLVVINSGTADGLKQQIKLKDKGYYTYKIYLQSGVTNLDIEDAAVGNLVQSGKALVYDGTEEVEYKEQIDGNPNNFIYVP